MPRKLEGGGFFNRMIAGPDLGALMQIKAPCSERPCAIGPCWGALWHQRRAVVRSSRARALRDFVMPLASANK
jgi:hypothetical protein